MLLGWDNFPSMSYRFESQFLSFSAIILEVMRPGLESPLYLFSLERNAEWLCQTNQFVMLRAQSMQQAPLGLTANDSRVIFNNSS